MSSTDLPAELAPEATRLGARRIRAMRRRVGMALNYGVPADEIMDWLVDGGCSVQLAEWIIDQAGLLRASRSEATRHAILADPVHVKSPIEVMASLLCAAAWLFLIAVAVIAWGDVDWLAPYLALGLILAGFFLLRNTYELGQCFREWHDRRRAGRGGSNS